MSHFVNQLAGLLEAGLEEVPVQRCPCSVVLPTPHPPAPLELWEPPGTQSSQEKYWDLDTNIPAGLRQN